MVGRDNVIPNINMDVGRPGSLEAQQHSIKDGAADADAIDIDDTVDNDPIGLQIEAGVSDKTAKALQLVATYTPIGGKATAYTTISIEELERAICAKQSHDSLVRRVQQGLATPIEDRPSLAGSEQQMQCRERQIWEQIWQQKWQAYGANGKKLSMLYTATVRSMSCRTLPSAIR